MSLAITRARRSLVREALAASYVGRLERWKGSCLETWHCDQPISREHAVVSGALEGLLVLDLTGHLSGPYCAMMLADHGAEVIKIERPVKGDDARKMPPFVNGESAPFMIWNRNKKSAVLDFKLAADRDMLLTMVDQADILIENFRPGTLDRLGIGWEVVHARNPRLIYAAISGFGQTGPYRHRGGVRSDHPGDVGAGEHQRPGRGRALSVADRDFRRDGRDVPGVRDRPSRRRAWSPAGAATR